MIYDFDFLRSEDIPPIVIIGSGPAGIVLAKTLAESGFTSLVLEAGGLDWIDEVQDSARGVVVGDEYFELESSRLKYFGGSGNHWAGFCRPLDTIDFVTRDDIPDHLGWPIEKTDLDPFQPEANAILELQGFDSLELSPQLKEIEFAQSPRLFFGDFYLDFFKTSSRANVCLRSNVTALHAENGRVRRLTVSNPEGNSTTVEPRTVVLCMGGIDNSRLLLWSNEVSAEPVITDASTLGKYWHEHPHNIAGEVALFEPIGSYSIPWNYLFFAPTEAAMREFGILNATTRVHLGRELSDNVEKRLKDVARRVICRSRLLDDVVEHVRGDSIACGTMIELVWEQQPRAENRIALSPTLKDRFGVPRPILYWEKSPLDYHTAKVAMELFGRYVAENNFGSVRSYEHIIGAKHHPVLGLMAGYHHMGGTRMADRPSDGVVDADLKIFGMDNAYVLGSSVFPTGGHANPTYTIIQLALRLGKHLARRA